MIRYDEAMRQALDIAAESIAWGEVPVGALILDAEGRVIATSANEKERSGDPSAHAEICAIRRACRQQKDGWRLDGCTLIVTLEPCAMCAGAIVASRLSRLVYGAFDSKAGAVGSVWDLLRDGRAIHRPQVIAGICADEASAQLKDFFSSRRERIEPISPCGWEFAR